ncbi:hypothetical protein ACWCQL_27035 [Streptomyces sp. NPDC002073]
MRLRRSLGATLGALALGVALPVTADATLGSATCQYGDPAQKGQPDAPDSRECIEVPEVGPGQSTDAWEFENNTFAEACLFPEAGCQGERTQVPKGEKATADLKFRSVHFHDEA